MKKLVLIPFIFIFLLTIVNSQLLSTEDAVAVYRFETISGNIALDSTFNNLNGAVLGSPFLIPSKNGNGTGEFAITLDGLDDFIWVNDNPLFPTNNFSITAWINTSNFDSIQTVFSKRRNSTNINYEGEIAASSGSDKYTTRTIDELDSCFSESSTFGFVNHWTHIALVYDTAATQLQLFINGTQETTDGCTATALGNDANFTIGVKSTIITDFFNGSIDELYIFDFTLNQSLVQDIFENGIQQDILPNATILNVSISKNPVEILEQFTLFANYTNATDGTPVLNAVCFANSTVLSTGGDAGFGRGVLGIGSLSTIGNAVHTQVNDIFGNNILRVDIDNVPLSKASYGVNFRFHAHNQTPTDNLRVLATCHPNNLSFSNFTFIDQVNSSEAVISTSTGNDTIWGFKNIVLFGTQVASENCSVIFESVNTSIDKHWMIADTVSTLNLNNSFTSIDFGDTYTLRPNANERSSFVDAGFGLDVPNETTMTFNATSGLYQLSNLRHGRPFDFNDSVLCSADQFQSQEEVIITNVQDNVAPIVQINSIEPSLVIVNISNVTIFWNVNDPELLVNFINVSFPDGTLLIQTDEKPLILTTTNLTQLGNYTVFAFANDTGGLSTLVNDSFEVRDIDILDPVITLIAPANNTRNNTIPVNITFTVTDNFPNNLRCSLSNSTFEFDIGTFPQSVQNNLLLAEGETVLDQDFTLELTCFDNTLLNNSATLNLNYTLDTVPPIITPISPQNQQRFNRKTINIVNILANATDAPIFRFNITITNASDTIASFESRSPVNNVIVIDELISIGLLGVGNYTINHTASDPHTREIIGDYKIRKNDSSFGITYNDLFEIKYRQDSLTMQSFGTEKVESNDKYRFWFNSNATETQQRRTFTFEIKSHKPIYYLEDSSFPAHFIVQDQWVDFSLGDENAVYKVREIDDGNFQIKITTTRTNLNFNSVGDLNVISVLTTFEVFEVEQLEDFFDVTVCRTDTGSVLLLALFFFIAFALIFMGIQTNVGFIGLFGSVMLFILSWFIFACIQILATAIFFFSLVLLFFFIFRGFFPNVSDVYGGSQR